MGVERRAVSPFIKSVRDFLLGRSFNQSLRYEDSLSPRPPPPANLPDGVYARLLQNPYYKRDGRRESKPPAVIVDSAKRRPVASGKQSGGKAVGALKPAPLPGQAYRWKSP